LIRGNKKKSQGARSGLYGGWGRSLIRSFRRYSITTADLCGAALS